MIKRLAIILGSAGLFACGILYLKETKSIISKDKPYTGEGMWAGFTKGGKNARTEFEKMRLSDPAIGDIPFGIRNRELAFAATLPNDANISNQRSAGLTWSCRGPWNVGGMTRAFAIDVTDENTMLGGTNSGGIWKTTDGGTSWSEITPKGAYHGITCIAQDTRPGKTNIWYAGSGDPYASAGGGGNAYYLGNGMIKSTDNGLTWSTLVSTNTGGLGFDKSWDITYRVVTDASDTVNDRVYAATYGYLYKSLNGGQTWTAIKGQLAGGSFYTNIDVSSTGIVYGTLSSDSPHKGIWRSADGNTWTNIIPTNFPTTYNRIVSAIDPNNENVVYFLANTPGFGKATTNFMGDVEWNSLWKYTFVSGTGAGAGGVWEDLSINIPATGGQFDKFNCQGSYDLTIKVKPGDSNTVFIGGTNLYRSTTAFADSVNTTFIGGYLQGSALPVIDSYLNHHPDQHDIHFSPSDPDILYSANDGGVFRTDDNMASTVVWTPLTNGYITTMFYTTAIDHGSSNNDIVIGGAQDNGTWYTNSTTTTAPWKHTRGGDGSYCAIADNQSMFYFSIQSGKMQKASVDANGNVLSHARIDPIGGKDYLFINPFTLDPNNNNIMYLAGGKRLWRNSDLSAIPLNNTWDSISTNWTQWPDSAPGSSVITAVAVSKSPANRVYYGTSAQKVYRIDNADSGTPTPVNITGTTSVAPFPTGGYVNCIAIDPTDADNVMVVFSNYGVYSAFYSTNGGTTWQKAAGNLEATNGPSLRWASILPVNGGKVFLMATSIGLFATDSINGTSTTWVQQGTNEIGNMVCDMIDTRVSDGTVVVATHGHGIYSTKITSVSDIVTVRDLKSAVQSLSVNMYPNPVKDQATLIIDMPESAKTQVQIIDELGRFIRTIHWGELKAGKNELSVQTGDLKAGSYYCIIENRLGRKSRQFIVVK